MQEILHKLMTAGPFIPHGHCYLWKPGLVWLHLTSDLLIAIAYYSIPVTLVYFVRKRQDLPFNWIFLLFGGFIVACGTTHIMDVWTLWHPTYWLAGILKALTMLISVCTAVLLVPLVPKALALPSPAQLALINHDLADQIAQRQQAEAALHQVNEQLENRVQQRTAELSQSEARLRQVNESLEMRVAERTAELTQTNDRLQHELLERQRAELQLQELSTLQQAILSSANFTIISTDTAGTITSFNARAEKLLGYAATELVGKTTPAIIHDPAEVEHYAQRLSQELGTLIEPGFEVFIAQAKRREINEQEWSYVRKDGSRFPILLSVTALRDPAGSLTGFLGIGSDITARKAAEAALRESEERLQLALEGSGDGLWDWNITTNEVYYSPRWLEMLGYAVDEFPGDLSTWERLIHPEDKSWVTEILETHLKEGSMPYHFDYRVLTQSGNWKWIANYGKVVVRDRSGNPLRVSGTHKDVSDRKQAEKELRTLATQLEQSNQELQNFAFVASHDLKEPLRTIRNFSNLLQSRCGKQLSEQGKDYLDRMQNAAQRMQTLIDDILSLSRVTTQAEPFVPVDLNQVVQSVLSGLEMKIQETSSAIEVETLPTLEADPTQIHQLLQNLISNALKFHGEKPPVVKIRSQVLLMPTPKQNLFAKQMYQISIQDQGIGFDEQYHDRIFKIFERLHGRSEYEGTGIGLAVCRKIVERHNGSITAQSSPGQGSTFLITLPVKQLVHSSEGN